MELDSNNNCGMCSVLQGDGAGGTVQAELPQVTAERGGDGPQTHHGINKSES